eukprot:133404-Prymnesium_polylepis.2
MFLPGCACVERAKCCVAWLVSDPSCRSTAVPCVFRACHAVSIRWIRELRRHLCPSVRAPGGRKPAWTPFPRFGAKGPAATSRWPKDLLLWCGPTDGFKVVIL